MNGLGKFTKGVSVAMACALLMAFSTPVLDFVKVSSEGETPREVKDIYFNEDCTSCKYITIYDENDQLVYDKLVNDVNDITDVELKNMLNKSYYLMSNSITDYYILSK